MSTDSTDAIHARLLALAAARFEQDTSALGPDDDFFDALGIDSYRAMELLTDVEEAFGVEIPDYELQGVTTFGALATVIKRRL
ncbi:MAG: acyl carrier protein [Myxococcales bacterium]|nr:acyl carrier protein [Myxococcales bacterium]